jgi:hypothetical protein
VDSRRCGRRAALGLAALAHFLGPAAAWAHDVEIADFGEFRAETIGESGAPETTKGSIYSVDSYQLLVRTTCIRAKLGTEFGITLRDLGANALPEQVRIELRHPPFRGPDGSTRTVEAWWMVLTASPLYTGWSFEQPYEVVTGRWTFDVIRDGQLLARQRFDVVGPNEGCPAEVSSAN